MMGCFVTGTDTGVSKTLVSDGLLHALARHHRRVVGMKPVAAGLVPWGDDWASEDAIALRSASTLAVPPALDNPVLLPNPMSPHIAARRAGVEVRLAPILDAYRQLVAQADAVVVEGAGGWRVPLSETLCIADLAVALQLPVVLVVGLKLGCLNHAVLTAEAIRAAGLPLAGWVASRVEPQMLVPEENMDWLRHQLGRLGAPLLADIPWQATPDPRLTSFSLPKEWQ